ncbi:MAG TPA: polysaccharide biosynthesis protein [Nitrospirales bacterium]|nr:polysaccharide biosynthesis protein [Nitrospirales bacterium]HIO69894.1 polysaccharide biosynthesis protein [Nitrospirales bacterium]
MKQLILDFRRPLVVLLHVGLIVLANFLAFWLIFGPVIPDVLLGRFVDMVPWLVVIRGLAFIPFRLYEGLWRYAGIYDLRNIIGAVVVSTIVFYMVVYWGLGEDTYPSSIFLIDAIVLIILLGGSRMARRIYRDVGRLKPGKRILIYGAGGAGERIVRDMQNNPFYEFEPVGFLDDNPAKIGQHIHGVKVLGTRGALAKVLEDTRPNAVLIAIPSVKPGPIREIVQILAPFKIPIQTLPNVRDLSKSDVNMSQVRSLSINDLLERAPVGLDPEPIKHLIQGKRIMVTGAGGSIGAELCRQIISFHPSALILYERYEYGLYTVASELSAANNAWPVHAVIGDVTDEQRVDDVLAEHQPEVIFHAAAHKHVPLMELNPCEAVKNNVIGTQVMAKAAQRHGVRRFILISTDKAVSPSSVMGATKRVAELLMQGVHSSNGHAFTGVRFGNVLGSAGSVIPRFLEQIKAGGPVTVTHPEMRRYFMLIPEAVQLVLYAAALAKGGELFVLEMGESIKVVDLARNMIRLSGFVPEEEISVTFVGRRPGEKLREELIDTNETLEPSSVERVFRIRSSYVPEPAFLSKTVEELEKRAGVGDTRGVIDALKKVVPTYRPADPPLSPPVPSAKNSEA